MTTFSDTINQLSRQFTVEQHIFYTSTFFSPDGENKLYQWLKSCHKSAYDADDRLLFVQDQDDLYEYQGHPGKALISLQKYANEIDISNFFIVVVSANPNIGKEISVLTQQYSVDPVDFQYVIVNDQTIPQSDSNKDTFCILPWMHIYVGPDGKFLPCCVGAQDYPLGDINKDSIEDVINSQGYVALRKNMLTNKRSVECATCYKKEDAGLPSSRQHANKRWGHSFVKEPLDENIVNFRPLYLDIRLNNVCNLKCRMCSSYFSSAIAQEDQQIYNIVKSESLDSRQRSQNLDKILQYLPDVESLYFAGGEPLLASEHYTVLKKLLDIGKTDISISYNTNLTTLEYKNNSVLSLWKEFKNISVGASIDAEYSVAEYVRYGTVWAEIEDNIRRIKQECPNVNLTITSTVGFLNVRSLIKLQQRWINNSVFSADKFTLSTMVAPEHLVVAALPGHHKKMLAQDITNHINWCKNNGANTLANQWESVLDYMLSVDKSHCINDFKRLTATIDKHRNQVFTDVFPEFNDLL